MYKIRKGVKREVKFTVGSNTATPEFREVVTLVQGGVKAGKFGDVTITDAIPEITQEQIEWLKANQPAQFNQLFYEIKQEPKTSKTDKK